MLGLPLGHLHSDDTRSDLEDDFLDLCRRHRLPIPRGQRPNRALDGRLPLARASASSSKPTATSTTAAKSPSMTIASATSACVAAATTVAASSAERHARRQEPGPGRGQLAATRRRKLRLRAKPTVSAPPGVVEWRRWPSDGSRELFLLDGNSLAYRAFFALPESIATADGRPTNAIYGLASMLVKIIDEHHPRRRRRRLGRGHVGARGHLRPLQGPAHPRARTCCASSGRT